MWFEQNMSFPTPFKTITLYSFIAGLFIVVITGCQYANGPQKIVTNAATIDLQWETSTFEHDTAYTRINTFSIFYRIRGELEWTLIGQIPAISNPVFTIYHDNLGNGTCEFAVSAVDMRLQSSPLHTSVDRTAIPSTGWYLHWMR